MRRTALSLLPLVSALLLSPPAARATGSPDEVAPLLQRQTQELMDAVAVGAREVWERYLDERAFLSGEDGKVHSRAELIESLQGLPAGVSGSIAVTDFHATVHGDVAVATWIADELEDYHGHQLHCQYRATDTWLRTPGGWRLIASHILALRTDPPSIALPAERLDEYVGRYALTPEITYEIRRAAEGLEGQRSDRGAAEPLRAEAPDVLFVPGQPRYRKVFQRGPDGRLTGFAERREAWDIVWSRLP